MRTTPRLQGAVFPQLAEGGDGGRDGGGSEEEMKENDLLRWNILTSDSLN